MKKFFILIAAASIVSAFTTLAQAQIKVATTFTVLADMARNVAQEHAEVVSITKPGAEIHGYQPTPRDILNTSRADLILQNGLNLEAWFARFYERIDGVPTKVVSDGITPLPLDPQNPSAGMNPHGWMSLQNARIYIDNITEALINVDPKNAVAYQKNAQNYKDEIHSALDKSRRILEALPEERKWLTTCEGAFSYFAQDMNLKELFLWPVNADQGALPRQIQYVIDTIEQEKIPVVFCESTVSAKPAEQVARETGATFGGILYVDSLSRADGPVPTYIDLMTVTAQTIASGLQNAPDLK